MWQSSQGRAVSVQPRAILPANYQVFVLDEVMFLSKTKSLQQTTTTISLPMPDGSLQRFAVWETPMLSPELASKFPEVRTFTALGIDDVTASAYLDWTSNGFHGMVLSSKGQIFIDPYTANKSEYYLTYFKHDYPKTHLNRLESCQTFEDSYWKTYEKERDSRLMNRPFGLKGTAQRPSGSVKRTYRTAVAATGEYTQARGGTVASAGASIITTMNRVRGVYEKEVAVSFTLVDNTSIIYTSGSSDPFSNSDAGALINQSQTEIDSKIGSANYDLGHTFSTGGGGLAGLGVVCRDGQKARGITGSGAPFNDPYDIDYVAHEVGHQFGAPHTFNGSGGNCAGGNRTASSAYEPGSGSTIMAYAGICGDTDDLQPNSDAYFHTRSYDNILDYSTQSAGNDCPTKTNMTNAIPVLTMPTGGLTIPKSTPFALTASATDANASDVLTYCWEQYDLGAAGAPTNAGGAGPSFRSFLPTTSPTRYFPRTAGNPALADAKGETLPSVGRSFTFRCTVRDKKTETSTDTKTLDVIGGVEYDVVTFNVSSTAGPFRVTAPNTAGTVWQGGSTQVITWDVSGTNLSPISCSQVNILLSTDGGITYPTTLATAVANDGSQSIIAPNISTIAARVKIQAVGNIFFDISDANFSITSTSSPTFTLLASPDAQSIATTVVYQVQIGALNGFSSNVNLSVSGNPAGTTAVFGSSSVTPDNTTTLTIGNTTGIVGKYNITITGTSGSITKSVVVLFDAGDAPPTASNNSITVVEDIPFYSFKISDFNYTNTNVNALQSVRISGIVVPEGATFALGSTVISSTQSVSISTLTSGFFRFTPAPQASGNNYASFDFEVYDGVLYSVSKYKMTVNVTAINDIPVVVKNEGIRSFPQDVASFVIGTDLLQATDVEDAAPSLTFKIVSTPNAGKLLLNGTAINANTTFAQSQITANKLAYQPNSSQTNSTDQFTFQVTDSENGTTTLQTFAIDINEKNTISDDQIGLYPNPADTKITLRINFPSTIKLSLMITDMLGKEVRSFDLTKETGIFLYDIKLTDIPSGAYVLHIKTAKDTWVRKFVKTAK